MQPKNIVAQFIADIQASVLMKQKPCWLLRGLNM